MKIDIEVKFEGVVTVEVPNSVPSSRRVPLAEKIALARIVASVDNPDAPESEACDEYADDFELDDDQAGKEWDGCTVTGVGGEWKIDEVED